MTNGTDMTANVTADELKSTGHTTTSLHNDYLKRLCCNEESHIGPIQALPFSAIAEHRVFTCGFN
jgi:hypothetical protein